MKILRPASFALASALSLTILSACQDDVSPIGSTISKGEVTISVDSLILKVDASTYIDENIDARSSTNLIGNINVPEYGSLSARYVTQLLSASALAIPDSISEERLDSMKMILSMPRNATIGDTLAPQKLNIYRLNRQLPSDIMSDFNPAGYYDAADMIATRNYTLSALALDDSTFRKQTVLQIGFRMPDSWALDAFRAYRNGSQVFDWPQEFNKVFPGLYVEQSFGRGAMANVSATRLFLYYHYYVTRNVVENDVSVKKRVTMKDSVCVFSSSPEVIGSTIFKYAPSAHLASLAAKGKKIITTPTGYRVRFTFPAEEILKQYWASDHNLTVINNLTFALPATSITNDYNILPPPELLMIRTADIDEFFAKGKVPDNKTSFRGTYSATKGRYEFASMREYIVELKNKGKNIDPADIDFTLIPVQFETETVTDSYYNTTTVYVTDCNPYIASPRMAVIDFDKAAVVFTFTSQLVE